MTPRRLAAMAVLVLLAARPSAAQPSCSVEFTRADYAMGARPRAVAAADFDRDGDVDIVTANLNANTVTVRLNDGSGGFPPAGPPAASLTFPAGAGPYRFGVADFNNDSKPDLAVAELNTPPTRVLVLLNNGNWASSGFDPAIPTTIDDGGSRARIAIADFNRDGKADFAAASDDMVSIRLGNGNGTFFLPAPANIGPFSNPYGLVAGDFNRDGFDDFVVLVNTAGPDYIDVRYGNGNGTFDPPNQVTLSTSGSHGVDDMVTGDFNRDGRLDLAVTGNDWALTQFGVYILKGNTSGGFDPPVAADFFATGTHAMALAVGDFNADGALDLAAPNFNNPMPPGTPNTAVLLNNGDGTFGSPLPVASDQGPAWAAAADFNRDGRDDLVVANETPDNVRVHLNQYQTGPLACGGASFGPTVRVFDDPGNNPLPPTSIARAELTGDGLPDLVVTDYSLNRVTVLAGTGAGDFAALPAFTVGTNPYHAAVGDFNGDMMLDLAVANEGSGNVTVLRNDGGGVFSPFSPPLGVGTNPVSVAVLDLNADGKLDLAVANRSSASVSLLLGNGAGGFPTGSTVPLAGSSPTSVGRGDFDGDGRLDLAVADSFGDSVWILCGDGAGGVVSTTEYPLGPGATSPVSLVVGDFDKDGDLDVATANNATHNVSLLVNNGIGALSPAPSSPFFLGAVASPRFITEADINQDTNPDVVTANFGLWELAVLPGNGAGGFGVPVNLPLAVGPLGVVAGDLDGDGRPDLATPAGTTATGSNVDVFHNNGMPPTFFDVPKRYTAGTNPRAIAVGDLDRDGQLDLVVTNTGSGTATLLRGQGGDLFAPFPASPVAVGSSPQEVVLADLDGNGILDMAVANSSAGTVTLRRGDGSGGFPTVLPGSPVVVGTSPRSLVAGDFDRDGDLDIAVANNGSNSISILLNAAGAISLLSFVTVASGPEDLALGDFNRDGDLDLAVANFGAGNVEVLLGGLGLSFGLPSIVATGAGAVAVATADIDRDGWVDIAVAFREPTNAIKLLINDRVGGFFTPPWGSLTERQPMDVAVSDLNVDGRPDLVVASQHADAVTVYLGNATGFDPARRYAAFAATRFVAVGDFSRDGRPDLAVAGMAPASNPNVTIIMNTNCAARRLFVFREPSTCDAPGSPFTVQPEIDVLDDGGNLVKCDMGTVSATLIGGTLLGNTNAVVGASGSTFVPGRAKYTDLAVNPPGGRGMRLRFAHGTLEAFSRRFTQGIDVQIVGAVEMCQNASEIYSTLQPGYDRYNWTLDLSPISVAPTATVANPAFGTRFLDLTVTADMCSDFDQHVITVHGDLANVQINPPSPITVCASCTGPMVSESHAEGGPVIHQWGYRKVSATGAIFDIPGQTGQNYKVNGADFPGPGVYYLVVKTTPTCGTMLISPEVMVTVDNSVPGDAARFFTITSMDKMNVLQWVFPPGFGKAVLHRKVGTPECAFPADPLSIPTFWKSITGGTPDQPYTYVDDDQVVLDDNLGLQNGTKYCYTVFIDKSPIPGGFSLGRSNRGKPFAPTPLVKWSFSVGAAAMSPPGVGQNAIHMTANTNAVLAMVKAGQPGEGRWPAGWRPFGMNGPSQGRPSTVGVLSPPQIFVGSQDQRTYAIDANTGAPVWALPPDLLNKVLAPPAGMFTAFPGGIRDVILVGTANTSGASEFFALDVSTGAVVPGWPFTGLGAIGIISRQAAVDYQRKRVYFTSFAYPTPTDNTVWCVDLIPAVPTQCWAQALSNVSTSPTIRDNKLYVGTTDGKVHALDLDANGAVVWTIDVGGAEGPVKGVSLDRLSPNGDLYFATTNRVWAFQDQGVSYQPKPGWLGLPIGSRTLPFPSPPVFLTGGSFLYVGGGDGKLYRLNAADGTDNFAVLLGDPTAGVGSSTIDTREGYLYVGTEAGIVYAILIP